MARYKKSAFWLHGKVGRLAGTTIYRSKRKTIQREIVPVANPQTFDQMSRRVEWPNLVMMFQALQPCMKNAYENISPNISAFNEFIRRNIDSKDVAVYLTKDVVRQHFGVVRPAMIASGSLPSPDCHFEMQGDTNVAVFRGIGYTLTGAVGQKTVAQFSAEVIRRNPGYRNGDMLCFVLLTSSVDDDYGTLICRYAKIKLDELSTDSMSEHLPSWLSLQMIDGYRLGGIIGNDENENYGLAVIHTRNQKGRIRVSNAFLSCTEVASAIAENYTDSVAKQRAIDSYGVTDETFIG